MVAPSARATKASRFSARLARWSRVAASRMRVVTSSLMPPSPPCRRWRGPGGPGDGALGDAGPHRLQLVGAHRRTRRQRGHARRGGQAVPVGRVHVGQLAVYLDESGRSWLERAETVRDVIGPQPDHFLDRYEYERIAKAIHEVHAPDRELGRSLGIG
jgi:hypothetical protein